jgi:hypothetical protein
MVLRIYNNPTHHPSIFHSFKKYSSSKANTRRRKQNTKQALWCSSWRGFLCRDTEYKMCAQVSTTPRLHELYLAPPTNRPQKNLKPKYRNVARSADESSAVLHPTSGTHSVRCSPHSENIKNCSVVGKDISFRRTNILVQAQSGRERPFPPCVYLAPRSYLSFVDL